MTDCMRTQQESEMTGTCLACKSIKMANHKTCIFCRQLANGMDILLAHCFAGVLHDWLSKTEMTEVNRLNDLEKSELVCHSHDFCDANMALLEGLKLLNIKPSIEYNCETEKNQCDAANEFEQRAWTIAKNAHTKGCVAKKSRSLMRHRILTCKNHPQLRWSVKDIAIGGVNPGEPALYNGSRNICFCGTPSGKGMYYDESGLDCSTYTSDGIIQECTCPSKDLVIAPEDPMVTR